MSAKPTPTPWATGVRNHQRAIAGAAGEWVALLPHGHREGYGVTQDSEINANAALIVKAVNAYQPMLEMLEGMLPKNVCLTNNRWPDDSVVPIDVTLGDLRKLAATIALAKGETA